jgi:exodeoxyribonuclease III
MKVVTWNCCQGFDGKAGALLALRPDIAVVPESHSRPAIAEASFFQRAVPHRWTGSLVAKGLGLFGPTADRLESIDPVRDAPGECGIAARAWHGNQQTTVVGVWTVRGSKSGNSYLKAAQGIISRYSDILEGEDAVVAGDFNVSGKTDRAGLLSFVRMMQERFGLVSAYHTFTGLGIGEERDATLWWQGKESQPYHCDFVFVPAAWAITNVEVGSFAEWGAADAMARSDHAPMIVSLER